MPSAVGTVNVPLIQWYPGHIAKAEKLLHSNLEKVDLIIEVRDARIPLATAHPYLDKWIKDKKHILVMNRRDMIPDTALQLWDKWLREKGENPLWANAKDGTGVGQIKEAAKQAGNELNKRRASRGMLQRPVRALTLGFPNVGKSALINRLVRKKVVQSSRRPGVTRSFRWVRIGGGTIDLLDAPGVLPARLEDQNSALKLALCDDIGQAAYEIESVAIAFIHIIQELELIPEAGVSLKLLEDRYKLPIPNGYSFAYQWLSNAADLHTSGDTRRMAIKLLDDFRKNLLGYISLELPSWHKK